MKYCTFSTNCPYHSATVIRSTQQSQNQDICELNATPLFCMSLLVAHACSMLSLAQFQNTPFSVSLTEERVHLKSEREGCLSVCLPVYLPVCLPACLSVCLSVCHKHYMHIIWLCDCVYVHVLELIQILKTLYSKRNDFWCCFEITIC